MDKFTEKLIKAGIPYEQSTKGLTTEYSGTLIQYTGKIFIIHPSEDSSLMVIETNNPNEALMFVKALENEFWKYAIKDLDLED